jgi:hypothetical protein
MQHFHELMHVLNELIHELIHALMHVLNFNKIAKILLSHTNHTLLIASYTCFDHSGLIRLTVWCS